MLFKTSPKNKNKGKNIYDLTSFLKIPHLYLFHVKVNNMGEEKLDKISYLVVGTYHSEPENLKTSRPKKTYEIQ